MGWVLLGLIALVVISAIIIWAQFKRIAALKNEYRALCIEYDSAVKRLFRLNEYLKKNKAIEGETDEKRRGLNETADSELVSRANNLFSGVRGGTSGSPDAA